MDYTLSNEVTWLPNQGWDARIHIAANADLVNVFVLITERYVILVDTLLNPTTAKTLIEFAQPYFTNRQLLVINSHADWDHAWGNQLFAGPTAQFPAPIIAHAETRVQSERAENLEFLAEMQRTRPDIFADVVITRPTITFDHNLIIDGGDLSLHLFPTPGHTADHIAIFIPEISTLLAGDAAEIPFPILHDARDMPALRASLQAMANLNPHHAFYCHAPPAVGPQLLHDNLAYYDVLERACRAALRQGIDIAEVSNEDLPALLDCAFADVAPTTGAWTDALPPDQQARHGQQVRLMWDWLQG